MTHVVPLDELRSLACGVALDEDLEVMLGKPGSGWFINTQTGLINVDGGDLETRSADFVRGLICHEAAHAAVTRYAHIMPRKLLMKPGIASLMNALEDCRIEEWLQRRFPGSGEWITLYNNRLFPEDADGLGRQPYFQQFCLGAIHEWWWGELPPNLHELVVEALDETRDARRAIVDAQPPYSPDVDVERAFAYHNSRVARLFRRRDMFVPPDAFEREVRVTAYDAYSITWVEVRPIYEELIKKDAAHMAQMKQLEQNFLRGFSGIVVPGPLRRPRRGQRTIRIPGMPGMPPGAFVPGRPDGDVAELSDELREALMRAVDTPADNEYEEARRDVGPYADRMVDELERILRPSSYPRWVPGYPTGSRIDLPIAMRLEVEPGAYLNMWQRKTLPQKRDPAFLLLLDLSGSMAGECIHHGFRGVVLVAEVLARLNIPFAVYGFQDVLIPFKSFATPLDANSRRVIGEMPGEVTGSRKNGHNQPQHNWDGPVLLTAADRFDDYPAQTRLLLVVSDGIPSGPSDADGALHRAVRRIQRDGEIDLIGIGLGPGTDHVAKFYPDHIANIPLEGFPRQLGQVIDRLLRGTSIGTGRRSLRT